jgi:hypothetical protein
MPPSAETIGALAAALAKAQAELTNPEKSLTATLPAGSTRRSRSDLPAAAQAGLTAARTFSTAPISIGIIRSKHYARTKRFLVTNKRRHLLDCRVVEQAIIAPDRCHGYIEIFRRFMTCHNRIIQGLLNCALIHVTTSVRGRDPQFWQPLG